MSTKFYIDAEGNYLGGFVGAEPPVGAIEVPEAPADARQKWSGDAWSAAPLSLADYENAIQDLVDTTATGKMFRDGVTLASYVASTNPQWAAEAQAFVAWRDAVWAYSYAELAKAQAGEREQPTPEEFLEELPAIAWPE